MNYAFFNLAGSALGLRRSLLLVVFVLMGNIIRAQSYPGVKEIIHSSILNQDRIVQVLVPAGYDKNAGKKYNVLFVLDGEGDLNIASAVQQFSQESGYTPPVIIVGIFNRDRDHDLTPTPVSDVKHSGGAANFLSFLKKELIPFIDQKYPSDGHHLLIGHSLGGLFTFYSLINEPLLFDSYIAIDPSVWWDDQWVLKQAAVKLAGLKFKGKRLYVSGREDMKYRQMALNVLDSVLNANPKSELIEQSTAYANESHNSIRLKSIYDGLRFIYADYKPPVQKP